MTAIMPLNAKNQGTPTLGVGCHPRNHLRYRENVFKSLARCRQAAALLLLTLGVAQATDYEFTFVGEGEPIDYNLHGALKEFYKKCVELDEKELKKNGFVGMKRSDCAPAPYTLEYPTRATDLLCIMHDESRVYAILKLENVCEDSPYYLCDYAITIESGKGYGTKIVKHVQDVCSLLGKPIKGDSLPDKKVFDFWVKRGFKRDPTRVRRSRAQRYQNMKKLIPMVWDPPIPPSKVLDNVPRLTFNFKRREDPNLELQNDLNHRMSIEAQYKYVRGQIDLLLSLPEEERGTYFSGDWQKRLRMSSYNDVSLNAKLMYVQTCLREIRLGHFKKEDEPTQEIQDLVDLGKYREIGLRRLADAPSEPINLNALETSDSSLTLTVLASAGLLVAGLLFCTLRRRFFGKRRPCVEQLAEMSDEDQDETKLDL